MVNVSKNGAEEPAQISYQQISYERLDEVLAALGFVRKETKELIAYRETDHGAFIILPAMSADSIVGDPHLMTVRNTVVGKGITSIDNLDTLIGGLTTEATPGFRRPRSLVKPRKSVAQRPSVKKRTAPASA